MSTVTCHYMYICVNYTLQQHFTRTTQQNVFSVVHQIRIARPITSSQTSKYSCTCFKTFTTTPHPLFITMSYINPLTCSLNEIQYIMHTLLSWAHQTAVSKYEPNMEHLEKSMHNCRSIKGERVCFADSRAVPSWVYTHLRALCAHGAIVYVSAKSPNFVLFRCLWY